MAMRALARQGKARRTLANGVDEDEEEDEEDEEEDEEDEGEDEGNCGGSRSEMEKSQK